MKLSRIDRWMLSNQYRILEALYPNEAEEYAHIRDAIESGYELEYEQIIPYIYEEGLSEDECREVKDIMAMFSILKESYNLLEDKSGIDEWKINFRGFSGNDETSQMAYAQYLRERGSFRHLERGDDFNSHFPALSGYRKMLAEWRKSENEYALSREDIIRIISA
jgi:uncharacterized protein YfbU (UPF0304 family)